MDERKTSHDIDEEAARWVARLNGDAHSREDGHALNAWLDVDARHLGAYARARAALIHMDRAHALGADFGVRGQAAGELRPATTRRVLLACGAAMAASCAALGIGVLSRRYERSFATQLGETHVIPLEDGSVVTLNTHSKVTVRYTEDRRDVHLLSGEAFFDVAKDRARPFIVTVSDMQVRAVGTSFTVQCLSSQPVKVLVREGVVEVKRPDVPTAPPLRVAANTRAIAPSNAPIAARPVTPAEVNRELVWRVGRIAFEGETLTEAAEMFARYSDIRIVIDDPMIANETIAGLFVSNDPVGFSEAVAISLNLHVNVGDGEVRLSRAR